MKMRDRHDRIIAELEKIARDVIPVAASRHAAAIVYKRDIVAFGINKSSSHPFQKRYSKHPDSIAIHAENDALVKSLRHLSLEELSNSKLYIARVKYSDDKSAGFIRGLSRPCRGCLAAIIAHDIKHVCYTTEGDLEWM